MTAKGGTATQEVTVTITGTNDIAKITGQSTGAVIEDKTLISSGKLTVSTPTPARAASSPRPTSPASTARSR